MTKIEGYYLEVRSNNCFCLEVCSECKQWFDAAEEVVYYKVVGKERTIVCPSCFPKLIERLRNLVLEVLGG